MNTIPLARQSLRVIRPRRLVAFAVFVSVALGTASVSAATISGLFATGVDNAGALLPGGSVDPHYRLVQSADASAPGPNAIVINEGWPIIPAASGVWLANGPTSKWISPLASQATGNLPGNYVYRLTFDLGGLDPDTVVLTGRWTSDNGAVDILVNGQSSGLTYSGAFGTFSEYWTLTAGFVEGTNALDFVINNGGPAVNPTGFRAELSGTADPMPPPGTPPSITREPASASVPLQDPTAFSVKVYGARPLFYQWRFNGQPLSGATNSAHAISAVSPAHAGGYDVVVTNSAGAVTSLVATLTAVFTPPAQPAYEPLGPCNRRSALVFSEIMYHPHARADARNVEFIELYNSNPWPEDLSGWRLSGDIDFTFADGTSIAGQSFLVVAPSPADVEAVYGLTGVLGGFTNRLSNDGGTLRLRKRSGGIVLDVNLSDQPPWPAAADGAGHSLVLARPSFGERDARAWAASAWIGGSPGAPDPLPNAPQDNVVLNELLAHSLPPQTDFVELFNYSPLTADLSGCWLTDDPATNKFRIPDGTVLAPRGFVAFDEATLGFGLSANGETVFLVNSNETRVLDAVRFGGQAADTAWGRTPDGAPVFNALAAPTPGTTNAPAWLPPVVINEIMFHPISGLDDDEFVELFNRSGQAVDLTGWQFTEGIRFSFPSNTSLAAGAFLVVAKNAARLRTNYAQLTAANCLGDFGGTLGNGGDRLVLARPETAITTNQLTSAVMTNRYWVTVNEVSYLDQSRWSRFADGGGSSLELIDPRADNRLPAAWADSDETGKAPWTPVEWTGLLDNAMSGVNADQVQLFLLGPGEALVDDVEVNSSGVNRVPNPGFEGGVSGWVFQGTQTATTWETNAGYNSARSLHLRASDRGEPIGNRVRAPLSVALAMGSSATLRAKVRWLAGTPEFLMRLRSGALEATARLSVPAHLGTPAAPNSRGRVNAGPVISAVTHRPVLPQINQPVRVLARVQDADGLAAVTLKYRVDPGTTITSLPMRDDGTGGDALAGDGVFTTTIPSQATNALIAFTIEAADAGAPPATRVFPDEAPAHEGLIRIGDPFVAGPFGNYRFWMTQATLTNWAGRGNLNNDPLDVTFVYGTSRVIYNAGALYGGSPAWSPSYNSPVGNLCAYDVLFPGDDLVLNDDKLGLDIPIRDVTNQREQLMHWIADQYDLPNLYRRDVYLFVNGLRRGSVYHDTQQPGGDFLEEWFSDDPDGTLVKSTQWSEGTDPGVPQSIVLNSLERFTSGGALKTARYRWNWRRRATDSQLDYTNFLSLVETANATNAYQSAVEGLVNVDDWMRMFAMNDLCGYWDAFGNPNAKNTFLYKARQGTWRLIPWDFDVGLGASNNNGEPAGPDAPLFPGNVDPTVRRMYAWPAFVRAYWRELEFGTTNILPHPAVTPLLSAKYDGYRTNGLSFTSPFVGSGPWNLSLPAWLSGRRTFLLGQLATVGAVFRVTTPLAFSTNRNAAMLSGTAPVGVKAITVNGLPYPVTWTTVSNWTMLVPLQAGSNTLTLAGLDRTEQVLSNTLTELTVDSTAPAEDPASLVVINEIMYNPLAPEASYVELFNRSTNSAFDLSGWQINGLGFTFAPGALIGPGQFLVIAKDREAFARAYSTGVPVFAAYNGQLDDGGETLTLLRPGVVPGAEVVVDRVTYDDDAPWPPQADGYGAALQLINPAQDNSRVSNWGNPLDWQFFSFTGQPGGGRLFLFLTDPGDIYLDDFWLTPGTVAEAGTNLVRNGDFESTPLTNAWLVTTSRLYAANSTISTQFAHSGHGSLHLVFTNAGSTLAYLYQDFTNAVSTNVVYTNIHTMSFWYLPTTSVTNLTVRMGSTFRPVINVNPKGSTPGAANNVSGTVPPYPPLWLSELQPQNVDGPTDEFGAAEPWIELFNAGPEPLTLDGFFLSSSYAALTEWAFPTGSVIAAGEYLLVWADGQSVQTAGTNFHTSFRLNPTNGSVALSRLLGNSPQLLDYLNYSEVATNRSFGAFPPAQASYRQVFLRPTPRAENDPSAPPVALFINEWMAANTSFLPDPADGRFDDWFEIYNPNTNAVDLGGFTLTDTPANPNKHVVPSGVSVPAQGFLLVWADEDSVQTQTNGDLHVNFRLAQTGEAIGLYDPQGRQVDLVAFAGQTNNVSQGRFPDASGAVVFMTTPTPRAPNVYRVCVPGDLRVASIIVDGTNSVTLLWPTANGCNYRVQFKDDLASPNWIDLPGDVSGGGSPEIKLDPNISGTAQRFYRVMVAP
ncbi:MAG: lamin tail domain-containing protein [Verrucomicrobia bacterium]|nr:lamin tail domain-containing protein [Verrucomicrobiota bacterium]